MAKEVIEAVSTLLTEKEIGKLKALARKHRKIIFIAFAVLPVLLYFFALPIYLHAKIKNFNEYTLSINEAKKDRFEKVVNLYIDKPIVVTQISANVTEDNDSVICLKNRFDKKPKEDPLGVGGGSILGELNELKKEELTTKEIAILKDSNIVLFKGEKIVNPDSIFKLIIPFKNEEVFHGNYRYSLKIDYYDANTKTNNSLTKEGLFFDGRVDINMGLMRDNPNYKLVHIYPPNSFEFLVYDVKLSKNESIFWKEDNTEKYLLSLMDRYKVENYSDLFIKGDFEGLNNRNVNIAGDVLYIENTLNNKSFHYMLLPMMASGLEEDDICGEGYEKYRKITVDKLNLK